MCVCVGVCVSVRRCVRVSVCLFPPLSNTRFHRVRGPFVGRREGSITCTGGASRQATRVLELLIRCFLGKNTATVSKSDQGT